MVEFLSIKPETFGLDISDSSLKLIKLKRKGRFFGLASFGEFKIEPGVVKDGEIKNEKVLVEIIKNAVEKNKGEKLNTEYIIASLPEQKTFLKVIQMPKMTKEELQTAIFFEVENYIPLSVEQVYLDFQIVGSDNLTQEVLIVALPKNVVNSYLSLFKKAGLRPRVFEAEPMAICRALIKNGEGDNSWVLINLKGDRINFIIFSKNSIRLTSSNPISGENLVELAGQTKKYIEYYQSHYPKEKRIEKILLCGGEKGNLEELTKTLSKELKLEVKLGNPLVNILPQGKKALPQMSYEESLKYSTCLGLALRGIRYD